MNNPLNDAELAEIKAAMGRGMTPTWEEVDRLLDLVEHLESEVKDADLNAAQAVELSNQRKQEGNGYRAALVDLKGFLSPVQLLSESETNLRNIIDTALNG